MSDNLKSLNCKNCGGELHFIANASRVKCEFCGKTFVLFEKSSNQIDSVAFQKEKKIHYKKLNQVKIENFKKDPSAGGCCPNCGFIPGWDGSKCSNCFYSIKKDKHSNIQTPEGDSDIANLPIYVKYPLYLILALLILIGLFLILSWIFVLVVS